MTEYTFYIEGLNRNEKAQAETERKAWGIVWNGLSDEDRDAVVSRECIEERIILSDA